jgi:PAS domain S-box-containing protein
MVVDDDPAILDYYRKIFMPVRGELDILEDEKKGPEQTVDLRAFALPSELLAAFAAGRALGKPVPLCILDMRMPEQNGLSAAVALRKLDPEVAIIICTAYSDASADTLEDKLETGVFLVHKPFVAEEFKLLVHSILREWEGRQALKKSEERLRQIIEATRVGTWEWSVKTGEAVFNERWAEIAGYTLAELAPVSIDTWTKLAHPEDLEQSGLLLKRHFAGELPAYDFECRMRHKDGRWVWVHDRGRVMERDANGEPVRMSGTHSEITGRKQAEAEIRHQAALIKSLLDSLTDVVFYKDINGVFLGCNPTFARLVGRPREEIIGKTDFDMFSGEMAAAFREQDKLLLEVKQPIHNEVWLTLPDGAKILVDTLKTPYWGPDGELVGILGLSRDITERRRAE